MAIVVTAPKQWNDGKIDGSEGLGGLRDVGVEVVVEWIGVVWREGLVDGTIAKVRTSKRVLMRRYVYGLKRIHNAQRNN